MILFRCFAWSAAADPREPDGALWFPRPFQGAGRHDNIDAYGCLYLTTDPDSGVVEQLAAFRGRPFAPRMLVRRGLPLALATIELDDGAELTDLDRPDVLGALGLRPSLVATRDRAVTQPQALRIWRAEPDAAGIRWWSTLESRWTCVTLFDRASHQLRLDDVVELAADDPAVVAAIDFLALGP